MSLARHIGNADFMVEAACAKVFCLLSAGLYKEAFDEVGQVDISNASSPYLYLKSASNLNGNLNCSKELEHYSS